MSAVVFIQLENHPTLPDLPTLRTICGDFPCLLQTDTEQAAKYIEKNAKGITALVLNVADFSLLSLTRKLNPKIHTVLVSNLSMEKYSAALDGKEDLLLDHLVAHKESAHWDINQLRITLQKILRQDIFGVEKYLAPGTVIQEIKVCGSSNRDRYNQAVTDYAQKHDLGQHINRMLYGISEELIMNAVYDAPVASGRPAYFDHSRSSPIELPDADAAYLRFAFDGQVFAISAVDPFGALKRDKLFFYLKKVLKRHESDSLIDNKKGGAGLGIFKILYSSHSFICNVQPEIRTEVIALIDIQDQLRDFAKMARSVHFFEITK